MRLDADAFGFAYGEFHVPGSKFHVYCNTECNYNKYSYKHIDRYKYQYSNKYFYRHSNLYADCYEYSDGKRDRHAAAYLDTYGYADGNKHSYQFTGSN